MFGALKRKCKKEKPKIFRKEVGPYLCRIFITLKNHHNTSERWIVECKISMEHHHFSSRKCSNTIMPGFPGGYLSFCGSGSAGRIGCPLSSCLTPQTGLLSFQQEPDEKVSSVGDSEFPRMLLETDLCWTPVLPTC